MFFFGSGVLLGQRTDVANSTPVNFGLVQEVTLDTSFDLKELYGQYQFAVALGRGKAKFTGKAKMARISGLALANLFFGVAIAAGQTATAFAEGPTPIPTTPFQITVTNGATFVDDYGVINNATGLPFTRVASGPVAGQYSVNTTTGVYTFASADNVSAISVLISYTYTIPANGEQIVVTNPLMGVAPSFQCQLYGSFAGLALNCKLYYCVAQKLATATKLDDFMIPELDFSIQQNAAGSVMNLSFGDKS